jgi:hypothetical protein
MIPLAVGDFVLFFHAGGPNGGPSKGRILRVDGNPGHVLVKDLRAYGAREWWPMDALTVVPPDPWVGPWPPEEEE